VAEQGYLALLLNLDRKLNHRSCALQHISALGLEGSAEKLGRLSVLAVFTILL